jgi:hypothetical protein
MDKSPKKPKLTDAERRKRFVEMAKKVEASENLEDFDRAFLSLKLRPTSESAHSSSRKSSRTSRP